ncbi:TetR/AcrR family transcriptional regulator [Pseudoduganella sp. RAF53_2]|uniref:TetR/AcrR family transcriptional regulator n=1 Tax=unclassified Pseudoduganella TaxID=2637179 RepID=UPI003F9678B2
MDSQKSTKTANAGEAKARRRARGVARVAALLEAAAAEFAEKGYETATMTAIAARAESSIGSLYQFFATKELVAQALFEQYLAQLGEVFEGLRRDAETVELPVLAARLTTTFIRFRKSRPAFLGLAELQDPVMPGAQDIRRKVRGEVASVLAVLAPELPARELEIRAAVIQHLMKAAVALNAEVPAADRGDATAELQGLVEHYLAELISAGSAHAPHLPTKRT